MKKILYPATIAALTLSAMSAQAVVIANWTFETSIPLTAGPFAPEVGAGSGLGFHAATAAVYSSPAGNGSTHAFSSNNWAAGDYYQFTASTVGQTNISFTFDQTGSNTGPLSFLLAYTTDGTSYSNFQSYNIANNAGVAIAWSTVTNNPLSTLTFDLSSITALNNNANAGFRIVENAGSTAINGGTVGTAGTGRIDNVIIASNPVPEPASMAVLGLGVVALIRRRRSK